MKKVPVPFFDLSFYPKKNLKGRGDAGMVVTDNPEFADKLRRIRGQAAQTR
jgi:dTDP-4-amino-4,6-dideoxygalactose transaminase